MKINYDDIEKSKPRWKVGDVIYRTESVGPRLYLVAQLNDLDMSVTGGYLYTLINLKSGCSLESYSTIDELQLYLCDAGDRVLDGAFKYAEDDQ